MENPELENKLVMPKYALYLWGILLSPLAAAIFLSLNILKLGNASRDSKVNALVPLVFILLYAIVVIWPYYSYPFYITRYFGIPSFSDLNYEVSFLLQIVYTTFLIEWNWKKFLS